MRKIMTVRGAIDAHELGFTSMHEHTLTDVTAVIPNARKAIKVPQNRFPPEVGAKIKIEDLSYYRCGYFAISEECRNTNDEDLMTAEVQDFKTMGGGAILDCSAPGIRPNIEGVRRISEKSDVHIIACTGLYAEEYWPEKYKNMSTGQYLDYMMKEMAVGIEDTDIRAGHIKAAVNQVTDQQNIFLDAALMAAQQSGASITTHMGFKTGLQDGRTILARMLSNGLNPERLLLCHFQQYIQNYDLKTLVNDPNAWKPKMEYALEVVDQGVNVCFDTFGLVWALEHAGLVPQSDAYHFAAIVELINKGYEDQIVIGTDIYLKIMTRRNGGHGYIRLLNYVVPTLQSLGVSDTVIKKITIDNPARILSIK